MKQEDIFGKLGEYGVVPVIAMESVDSALGLADALIKGGLPITEITFRTAAAADVIALLKEKRPGLILGAGTILTVDSLEKAVACGAQFGVAPGFNREIVKKAQQLNMPFIPGISNPTDIEQALSVGCRVLKFFPAEACGGVKMLSAMSAPYKHTGVQFVPTGGVNLQNLQEYLALDTVLACGGTWIAKKDEIAAGKWDEIAARAQQVAHVRQ